MPAFGWRGEVAWGLTGTGCVSCARRAGRRGLGFGVPAGCRVVLTARHVIAPALAGPGGKLWVRPVGGAEWLPARVEWENTDADAALVGMEGEGWRPPAGESVLRWGELAGSDPVPCAAVGFPWASVRPDQMRDTAHVVGQLAPLGQLKRAGWTWTWRRRRRRRGRAGRRGRGCPPPR